MSLQKTVEPSGLNLLIVSAEASSNLYAKRLLEELKLQKLDLQAWGVGNQEMESLGFECIGHAEEMAVMGLVEVLKHYRFIKGIYDEILKQAEKRKPSLAILMDYAEFNLKLARDLKTRGIPVVFYISPQIWAWRQGRVKHIKSSVSEMLCIFPFEQEFYQKHGVSTEFVGHPLLDELQDELFDPSQRSLKRQKMGISNNQRVLGLLPGSRKSEIQYNFPTQIEAAKELLKKHPQVQVLVLVAPGVKLESLKEMLPPDSPSLLFLQEEPFSMLQIVDFALVTSGTATLVTGLMQVPMLVMYKMNAVSAFLAKRLVSKNNRYFAMINLIYGKELMPELFQERAEPKELSMWMEKMWFDEKQYQETKLILKDLPQRLGNRGATKRLVDAIRRYLK